MSGIIEKLWPATGAQFQNYGLAGDYIGGIAGTVVSLLALVALLATWRTARYGEERARTVSVLTEMLATHDQIAGAEEFHFLKYNGTPSVFLREFSAIYKIIRRSPHCYEWNVDQRIDVAYTLAYYGPTSQAKYALQRHGAAQVKYVADQTSKLKSKNSPDRVTTFSGHQITLSHYMRNLYSMYRYIDRSELKESDKTNLGKIIKSKLSNYDQAILCLNVISHLGQRWEMMGIVKKYKPFSNIPKQFFSFDKDFSLAERFPYFSFEWETNRPREILYRTFVLGRAKIVLGFWRNTL